MKYDKHILSSRDVLFHPDMWRMTTEERLLHACLCTYAKHHLNREEIGWDQLSHILLNALCEAIGDLEFFQWLEKVQEE